MHPHSYCIIFYSSQDMEATICLLSLAIDIGQLTFGNCQFPEAFSEQLGS